MARLIVLSCAGLILMLLSGCATYYMPRPQPVSSVQEGIYHPIEPGQTLWRIAKTYDVSLEDIIEVNNISDPAQVKIGDKILIPGRYEILPVVPYEKETQIVKENEFIWPLQGRITSFFGARGHRRHDGIDIAVPTGTAVKASRSGKVVMAKRRGGYGKFVEIAHGGGYTTRYGHNSKLLVKQGEKVKQGEVIAKSGSTGHSTGPHLHYEIRRKNKPQDPLYYLP